jgi:CelD/BcsL family acetyltransferase involved in cellulose biosynthesis
MRTSLIGASYARPVPDLTLERVEDPIALRDEWNALAERAGNVFATHEWVAAWWEEYGEDRPRLVTACRDSSGRLVALLPLYVSTRRPVRTVRFIGHGPADQLGPVCAPEDRQAAAAALLDLLRDEFRAWDLLLAERLPPSEGWSGMLGGRIVHREDSPTLVTGGRSFDEFLASRSRNFREQVRRRDRKLRREHEVEMRLATAQTLDDDLSTLFRLHEARWDEEGSGALSGARERFHRDFARRALERDWLRLWVLEADGAPRAAWYGFRFGGVDMYYQSGRDPEWERESVGFVLLCHTIKQAFDDERLEYRLLRGGEEYKGRFASDDPGLETVAVPRGMLGRGALLAARAARSMPAAARRRAVKLAG